MYAVVCLTNFWTWSGGMSQYLSWANERAIPYHPLEKDSGWMRYQRFTSGFYRNKKAQEVFEKHLKFLITRVYTETGIAYKDDPTIMSWQLANEPRSFVNRRTFRRWVDKTARYIKDLDPNHLVSLGSEGSTATIFAGTNFKRDHESIFIDYSTIHIWIQNWSWYDPDKAEDTFEDALEKAKEYISDHAEMTRELNKPIRGVWHCP